ncbi:uncharacterized protein LOC116265193 [Nymphaea colorata]|nr:uncharacterized protein LOC116265193 [Nymphaea colorata]
MAAATALSCPNTRQFCRWDTLRPIPSSSSTRLSLVRRGGPRQLSIRAFTSRGDFEDFAKRVVSGEKLKDFARAANDGIDELVFNIRRAAVRLDRRFSISDRLEDATRTASDGFKRIDREFGIGQRWRSFSMDFRRNLPGYRRQLKGFLETPLGKSSATLAFLWLALSGWLFRIVILATWILPFAAPLLIGTVANNFVIEGSCPACKRRFMGYKNQIIQCTNCRAVVWQPRDGFSGGRQNSTSSPDIIDIEIEEK